MRKFVEAWQFDLNPFWLRRMGLEDQAALLESRDQEMLIHTLRADRDAVQRWVDHSWRYSKGFWLLTWLPAIIMRRALDEAIQEVQHERS